MSRLIERVYDCRNRFIAQNNGVAPTMLLINHECWRKLCSELDPKVIMLTDFEPAHRAVPVMGMRTYVTEDIRGFAVGVSLVEEGPKC